MKEIILTKLEEKHYLQQKLTSLIEKCIDEEEGNGWSMAGTIIESYNVDEMLKYAEVEQGKLGVIFPICVFCKQRERACYGCANGFALSEKDAAEYKKIKD